MARGGVPGNSGGKPGRSGRKRKDDEEKLIALLDEAWPDDRKLAFFKKMADRAELGDRAAGEFLTNHRFGKPRERVEMTDGDGDPLRLEIVNAIGRVYAAKDQPNKSEVKKKP